MGAGKFADIFNEFSDDKYFIKWFIDNNDYELFMGSIHKNYDQLGIFITSSVIIIIAFNFVDTGQNNIILWAMKVVATNKLMILR